VSTPASIVASANGGTQTPSGDAIFLPIQEKATYSGSINITTGAVTQYVDRINQTPGPLPILGAGAAFGFSRKLRSRIKASV
jgi:hypothetical protein